MTRVSILRSAFIGVLLVIAALSIGLPSAAGQAPAAPVGISVDVTVEPIDATRTQFMCRARVAELDSGKVLMAPNLQILAGRSSIGRSGATEGKVGDPGHEVVFTAKVEEGGEMASYSVEYSRDGAIVAKQTGAISLQASTR